MVFAPQSTLEQADLHDAGGLRRHPAPAALRADHATRFREYNILYVGQQQEDELHCYVFDIAPKQIEGKKRYFQGRIWVDDHDFQIVKTYGKTRARHPQEARQRRESVPQVHHLARADRRPVLVPDLHQGRRRTALLKLQDVHIREIVKYDGLQALRLEREDPYEGKEIPKGEKKPEQKKPAAEAAAPQK